MAPQSRRTGHGRGDDPAASLSLIATGGTIAERVGADGVSGPELSARAVLESLPDLAALGTVRSVTARAVRSDDLTLPDIVALAELARTEIAAGARGVVVTVGTDTLEEVAFGLDLLIEEDRPVVVTGALRRQGVPGGDGPANLLSAFQVAAAPAARGLGVVVVLDGTVHAARFVRKAHTSSLGAFHSTGTGPIGWVSEGDVRIGARPAPQRHLSIPTGRQVPPVGVLAAFLGADGGLVAAARSLGYEGLVIEGFGGGHVPAAMMPELAEAAGSIPVVVTSRTGSGEALRRTYPFPGDEVDLGRRGVIGGGILSSGKAQVLLGLLLASGCDPGSLRDRFEEIAVGTEPSSAGPGA